MVDPATLPEILPPASKSKKSKKSEVEDEDEEERKIDLSEIIGLPDFDVCHFSVLISFSRRSSFHTPRVGGALECRHVGYVSWVIGQVLICRKRLDVI